MRGLRRLSVSALALAGLVLCSCSRETPQAPPPQQRIPEEAAPLPPTPTFTPTEAAFAANVDPLTGLPSEIEGIAGRPMMAYAIEGAHGAQAPAGIEAVELVVEHPPDPLNPKRMRLTALSRLEAGERPNLGPLGAATDLDLDIARAFGAGLTVLSLDPALDTDGVIVTRFSAPGSDEEGSASDASATLEQGYALETASAAANLGSDASASVVAPWVHLSETMVPDSGVEPVSDAPSNSLARAIVFDFSMLPGFVGGGPTAHHWNLDPLFGTWLRLSEVGGKVQPVPIGDAADATFLQTANLIVLRTSSDGPDWRWRGQGSGSAFAGARMREEWTWSRDEMSSPLTLSGEEGRPPALNPGSIWMVFWPAEAEFRIEFEPVEASP